MFNYEADDSLKIISAIDEYRICTFKTIMDTINNKIKIRYRSLSREICDDISSLDPINFKDIKNEGLPENAKKKIKFFKSCYYYMRKLATFDGDEFLLLF